MTSFIRALITGSLLTLLLAACGSSNINDPETQVRQVLSALEEAAERRSMSDIMDNVSDDYLDHIGQDKKTLARLVQFQILKNQKINIFSLVRSIEINDGLASVELSAAMSARDEDLSSESSRLRADAFRFSILLALEEDDWRIRSVSWKQGW